MNYLFEVITTTRTLMVAATDVVNAISKLQLAEGELVTSVNRKDTEIIL